MHELEKQPLLISTDFDGTLIMDYDEKPMAPAFFSRLEKLRQNYRVAWVINTGRDWASLAELLIAQKAPVFPDWVVLVEREVHRVEKGERVALKHWNKRCEKVHLDLFHRAGPVLEQMRQKLQSFKNLSVIQDIGSPLGLIAESEKQANEIQSALEPLFNAFPEIHAVRNTVYFRFAHIDFHKGSCLAAIAVEEGVSSDNCFAIGDHLNDLSMLDPRYARHIACPSNAVPDVKSKVRQHGGFVASKEGPEGVGQALDHFFG